MCKHICLCTKYHRYQWFFIVLLDWNIDEYHNHEMALLKFWYFSNSTNLWRKDDYLYVCVCDCIDSRRLSARTEHRQSNCKWIWYVFFVISAPAQHRIPRLYLQFSNSFIVISSLNRLNAICQSTFSYSHPKSTSTSEYIRNSILPAPGVYMCVYILYIIPIQ